MKMLKYIKLATTSLALTMMSSCMIEPSSESIKDSSSLVYYTSNLMSSYMLGPVSRLYEILGIDEYSSMSEADKEESEWHNIIYHIDDKSLFINGIGTIITDGKSIQEPGSTWTLTELDYSYAPKLSIAVSCVKAGSWTIQASCSDEYIDAESELTVSELSASKKNFFCTISCSGKQIEKEYTSEFSSKDKKFIFDKRSEPYALYLSGQFNVNIFKGNNMIDYCYTTYSGRGTSSVTSRD